MVVSITGYIICLALILVMSYHVQEYLTPWREKLGLHVFSKENEGKLHKFGKLNAKNNFIAKKGIQRVISCDLFISADYFISLLSFVRYPVKHEKRNFISPSNHVLFCLLYKHLTRNRKKPT